MRHEVIYTLYPQCTNITDNVGAFDIDNNKIDIDETLVQSKIKELKALEPMSLLRIERNRRLAETDWRMHSDYPGSNQEVWRTYRQALRDLPATQEPQLDSQGSLINITWPEVPE
tara:strand:+ start:66 stop:410 length:345 start_codon:yes stop_codon:yes gene_type:complete